MFFIVFRSRNAFPKFAYETSRFFIARFSKPLSAEARFFCSLQTLIFETYAEKLFKGIFQNIVERLTCRKPAQRYGIRIRRE